MELSKRNSYVGQSESTERRTEDTKTIEIREIKPDEYNFLGEMLYEAAYVPPGKERPQSIVNEPRFTKYIKNFGRPGDAGFVLVDSDELVGAVWVRLFDSEEAGYGFVDEKTPELSIAIREEYRNKGHGALMLEKLFERLRHDGCERISLSVDKRNPAMNLYTRLGFNVVDEQGVACTMLKDLSQIL